jgi:hypothetical protein
MATATNTSVDTSVVIQQLFASGTSNSNARAAIGTLSSDQQLVVQATADAILADPASLPDARLAAERVRRLLGEQNNKAANNGDYYSRTATLAEGDATLNLTLSPLEWSLLAISLVLLILLITFIILYVQQKNSTARDVGKAQIEVLRKNLLRGSQ